MASIYRGPLAGQATLTVSSPALGSQTFDIVGEAQHQASGPVNETLKGQSRVEGFSAVPGEGFIQATLRDRRDFNAHALQGASGLTVVLVKANGQVVTAVEGWQTDRINVNTQEGTFEFHCESDTVTVDVAA